MPISVDIGKKGIGGYLTGSWLELSLLAESGRINHHA